MSREINCLERQPPPLKPVKAALDTGYFIFLVDDVYWDGAQWWWKGSTDHYFTHWVEERNDD